MKSIRDKIAVRLSFEDVTNFPEAKETTFGFDGRCGVIRNNDNVLVGFYTLSIDVPVIELNELEIIDVYKGQGYGKSFMSSLFDTYRDCSQIVGQSADDAINFYISIGANLFDECEECTYDECQYSPTFKGDFDDASNQCDDHQEYRFRLFRD